MSTSVPPPPETKWKAYLRGIAVAALLAVVVFFAYMFIQLARERNIAIERQAKWLSAYLAAVRQVRDDYAANATRAVIEKHVAEAQQFGRSEDPYFAERDDRDRQRIRRSILLKLHEAVKNYAESLHDSDSKATIHENGVEVEVDKKVILRQHGNGRLKAAEADWQEGEKRGLLPPPGGQ